MSRHLAILTIALAAATAATAAATAAASWRWVAEHWLEPTVEVRFVLMTDPNAWRPQGEADVEVLWSEFVAAGCSHDFTLDGRTITVAASLAPGQVDMQDWAREVAKP